jgi:hypothetical protein
VRRSQRGLGPAAAGAEPNVLDACHRQTLVSLDQLAAFAAGLAGKSGAWRRWAGSGLLGRHYVGNADE